MTTIILDFEKRVTEIELYFNLLNNIELKNAKLYLPNNKAKKYKTIDSELIKVLKANVFLLLYNLAESSIRQSLTEIYDNINSLNLKYSDVIDEIKKIWIKEKHQNFKNRGADYIFETINNMANDIITINFDSTKIISGNIDGQKIRDFSDKHGFSSVTHHSAVNGEKLHTVKTQRNNLAHGRVSFAECGRQYSLNDLAMIKTQVIIYLRGILKNIKRYLDRGNFKI